MPDHFESRFIDCMLEDRRGALWVGSRNGLYRRRPDGRVEAYTNRDGLPDNRIHSLLEDREGRIWVGTSVGCLFRLVPNPVPGRSAVARAYSDKDGLPTPWIRQLFQASDGSLWAGSSAGPISAQRTAGFNQHLRTQSHRGAGRRVGERLRLYDLAFIRVVSCSGRERNG